MWTFEHTADGGSRFTHRVTITGVLAPLFARVIGRNVARRLPEAMRRLARLAEAPETVGTPGAGAAGTP